MLNTICVLSRRERGKRRRPDSPSARAARRTLEPRCDARARRTPHARPRPTSLPPALSAPLAPTNHPRQTVPGEPAPRMHAWPRSPRAAQRAARLPSGSPGPTARQLAAPLPQTHTASHARDTRQEYSPARQQLPLVQSERRTRSSSHCAYRLPATGENGSQHSLRRERATPGTSGHM